MDYEKLKQDIKVIRQDLEKAIDEIDEQKIQMDKLERGSKVVGWVFTGVILILTALLIITIIRGV